MLGKNGSGKSTLLQIICAVMQPTQGEVKVNGRISALLELGAGFNPEFTGRENVLLNGSIMGVPRQEMLRRLPDIEAFADIGVFFDQPVKTYSSGMFVRVAFAAAINVDPDILIVDEALAVGDAKFQHKCFDRFAAFKKQGKTIIFVS
ncbi:MAG: ABC transporter ATP-binding protein, partial [Methylobacter sp.]|nr:ABC transporter ATP-binding protein [Methylobacter sp.]